MCQRLGSAGAARQSPAWGALLWVGGSHHPRVFLASKRSHLPHKTSNSLLHFIKTGMSSPQLPNGVFAIPGLLMGCTVPSPRTSIRQNKVCFLQIPCWLLFKPSPAPRGAWGWNMHGGHIYAWRVPQAGEGQRRGKQLNDANTCLWGFAARTGRRSKNLAGSGRLAAQQPF